MNSLLRDTVPDTPSAPTPALGHLVYDGLLSDIASRRRGAGDRLVEATIAREMQVSRTPVREALSRLENDGLIQSVRPSGYVVICPSIDDIREIFEIRRALEPLAFAAVVARADPSEDATFSALFDGIQSADTPATFAACNIAFRGFWLQRTPNVRLRETLLRFHMQVQLVRAATLHSSAGREAARHGAQALSQAYLARDTALAHTAMQTFVDTALAYFERAEATGHLRPDHP